MTLKFVFNNFQVESSFFLCTLQVVFFLPSTKRLELLELPGEGLDQTELIRVEWAIMLRGQIWAFLNGQPKALC